MIKREDLDAETLRLMFKYCCGDPWARNERTIVVSCEYDEGTWPILEFQDDIASALAEIPLKYQESAIVTFEAGYDDERGKLEISYKRPGTDDEIAMRVQRAYDYAQRNKNEERRDYERLKRKFENDG